MSISLPQFTESEHCTSGIHCGRGKCRDVDDGRRWRQQLKTAFLLPGNDVDFECPHGKSWLTDSDLLSPAAKVAIIPGPGKIKIRLTCPLAPGDILMLTAAVRDLHVAAPGKYLVEVRTDFPDLWRNNPYVTHFAANDPDVREYPMHYHELLWESHRMPYHFLHGYARDLSKHTGERIDVTQFRGDIHLSAAEKAQPSLVERLAKGPYAVVMAGGKLDNSAKWWNPASYQAVVDHFRGRLTFIQCGESHQWHPPLRDTPSLVGKTSIRDFLRVIYRAELVVCPITFAMHAAAAVPRPPEREGVRPCVVIAGGREPPHFVQYPGHQFFSTLGQLPCCARQACWANHAQSGLNGPVDCKRPLKVLEDLSIPECMARITPEMVIASIEAWISGGMIETTQSWEAGFATNRSACMGCDHVGAMSSDGAYCGAPIPCSCRAGSRPRGEVKFASGRCPLGKWKQA